MREPIETSLAELRQTDLAKLNRGKVLWVCESEFPEAYISRDGDQLVVEITEHIYTKFWWHKYHAMVFAEAMLRAVKRLAAEGHPLSDASIENDDEPHIFIRWQLRLPKLTPSEDVISATTAAYNLAWHRANQILDDSDSV